MKREILAGAFIIVVGIALSSCQPGSKTDGKEVVANAVPSGVNQMPSLVVQQTDSTNITFRELTGKVLIIFFNPDCDHCQREGKVLAAHKEIFVGYEVYFVSSDVLPAIALFAKEYDLIEPNIHFAHAEGTEVFRAVGPIQNVPAFFIYKDRSLITRMEGEISLAKLKQNLQ